MVKKLKKYLISLGIREMEIITTLEFHLTPFRKTKTYEIFDYTCKDMSLFWVQ